MKAMILTAGLGTRLRPATLKIPKPAIPLLNVPLVGYSIHLLKSAGFTELVCNTHHLPHIMKDAIQRLSKDFKNVDFSDEEGKILGSAGGIKHAEELLKGEPDFLLANGDEVFFPRDPFVMKTLIEHRRKTAALATLLVQEHPDVGSKFGGVWIDSEGHVQGFGKTPPQGSAGLKGLHFTGYQALSTDLFSRIPPAQESNIFYDILVKAIAEGKRVNTVIDQGLWMEMGNPQDFLEATHVLLSALKTKTFSNGQSASNLGSFFEWGWKAFDPSEFKSHTVISNSVKISPSARLSGSVVLGSGFRSEGTVEIKNAVSVGKVSNTQLKDTLEVGDYPYL